MKAYVRLDGENRIDEFSFDTPIEGATLMDVPDDIDIYKLHEYRLENGTFVREEQPEAEPTPTLESRVETVEEKTDELREALELILSGVTE